MADTCRAVVFTGDERYEVREFPVPDPPPGGGVLRVEAVGMCGSDLAQWHGLEVIPGMRYPVVPGHEIVGVVHALAPDADLGVAVGDRVAVDEVVGRTAPPGVYGYTDLTGVGAVDLFGGYGEYMKLLPGTTLYRLTSDAPPEELTQFEPLANALNWVERAGVTAGTTIVIEGPGHQGLAVLQAALVAGAGTIIVTGTRHDDRRLPVALAAGADHVLSVDDGDVVAAVRDLTDGAGADVVFDVSPAPATVPMALELVRRGGTVLLAGLKEQRPVELVTDHIVHRSLRLLGGTAYTPASMAEAVRLLNEGAVDTAAVRGITLGLDEIDAAMRLLLRTDPERDTVRVALRHDHGPS